MKKTIRQLREDRGESDFQLADALSATSKDIQDLGQGIASPSVERLRVLTEHFGVRDDQIDLRPGDPPSLAERLTDLVGRRSKARAGVQDGGRVRRGGSRTQRAVSGNYARVIQQLPHLRFQRIERHGRRRAVDGGPARRRHVAGSDMRLPAAIGPGLDHELELHPCLGHAPPQGIAADGVLPSRRRTDRHPTGRASHPGPRASGRDAGSDPGGRTERHRGAMAGSLAHVRHDWHGLAAGMHNACPRLRRWARIVHHPHSKWRVLDGAAPTILEPVPRRRCAMPPTILVVDNDPGLRHVLVEDWSTRAMRSSRPATASWPYGRSPRQVPDLILSRCADAAPGWHRAGHDPGPAHTTDPDHPHERQPPPHWVHPALHPQAVRAGGALDADGPHAAGLRVATVALSSLGAV